MTAGIYLIKNKINGHMYIGGSIDIERRFKQHKRFYDLKNCAIDRAIKKYGSDNFIYQIITQLPSDWKIIAEHERYWIKFYNTFNNPDHYNLTPGGDGTGFGIEHPSYDSTLNDEKIIDLYVNKKLSASKIADKLNTNHSTVLNHLRRNGIEIRTISEALSLKDGKENYNYRNDLNMDEIIDMYVNKGMNAKEIANKLNTNQNTIYQRLRANGVKIRTKSEALSGKNNSNAKYHNLWNISSVYYDKRRMHYNNDGSEPKEAFRVKYKVYMLPIGSFIDFVSPKIIGDLIDEFAEEGVQ